MFFARIFGRTYRSLADSSPQPGKKRRRSSPMGPNRSITVRHAFNPLLFHHFWYWRLETLRQYLSATQIKEKQNARCK